MKGRQREGERVEEEEEEMVGEDEVDRDGGEDVRGREGKVGVEGTPFLTKEVHS